MVRIGAPQAVRTGAAVDRTGALGQRLVATAQPAEGVARAMVVAMAVTAAMAVMAARAWARPWVAWEWAWAKGWAWAKEEDAAATGVAVALLGVDDEFSCPRLDSFFLKRWKNIYAAFPR